jgi:hypothetical protein
VRFKDGVKCFYCKDEGHIARECPVLSKRDQKRGRFRSNAVFCGHVEVQSDEGKIEGVASQSDDGSKCSDSSALSKSAVNRIYPCFGCHGMHKRKDCPYRSIKCEFCHKFGHSVEACFALSDSDVEYASFVDRINEKHQKGSKLKRGGVIEC